MKTIKIVKPSKSGLLRIGKRKSTFQLKKSHAVDLPKNWNLFTERLADVLAQLKNKQYLILTVGQTNRFVQFATLKGGGMRVETTSNGYLLKEYQLNEGQIVNLARMGWEVPSKTPETVSESKEPGGSPNFYVDVASPAPHEAIAHLVARTFFEIYCVPDPGSLLYDAFKRKSNLIDLPNLGITRRAPQEDDVQDIATLLLETIKGVTGLTDIEPDQDGDIGISCGSAVTYIRPIDDGKRIHLFSPVVRDVAESNEVIERLKSINANTTDMQFTFVSGAMYAGVDVPADPYDSNQVAKIFEQFSQVADCMGILLQGEFGGKTWIAKTLPTVMRH